MDNSIINAINELQEIIDFYYTRNTEETVEFILERIEDEEIVRLTLLESIGLFDEDESNINWNYIIDKLHFIIDRIEGYVIYQKVNLINIGYIGYEFETEIQDDNKCGNPEDALYYDWDLLDDMDDLEVININGTWHGTTPSRKKEYEDIRMYY